MKALGKYLDHWMWLLKQNMQSGWGSSDDTPLSWVFCFFLYLCVLNTSLLSDTTRCFRLILYISFLSPRINHFFKESCLHLLENFSTNQDLGARCIHCYWDFIVSRDSQLKKQGKNIYIYMSLSHVYTCIYKYICNHKCLY